MKGDLPDDERRPEPAERPPNPLTVRSFGRSFGRSLDHFFGRTFGRSRPPAESSAPARAAREPGR